MPHVLRELAIWAVVGTGVLLGDLGRMATADEARSAATTASSAPGAPGATASEPVFPIPGETRAEPHFAEGRFGAFRPGRSKRRDCGHGHCGIDLCAAIGTPVIAVMDGVVAQIDRSTGGEGGRWVRLQHDDGTSTWYMHLARIRDGLVTGAHLHAGDKIASLGRTGVTTSPTHLHFALTVGAPGHEKHLDPTAFLAQALLLAAPFDAKPAGPTATPELEIQPPEKIRRSQKPEF